jgi:hypothetical protein
MKRRDLFTGELGIACPVVTHPTIAQLLRRRRLAYLSGENKARVITL